MKNIVGVLAIQGSVVEHIISVERAGGKTLEVRSRQELDRVDRLIIPGGESSTVGKLLKRFGLGEEIKKRVEKGMPIYGTCTGAILLAKKIVGKNKADNLGLIDLEIERNAYGSQVESFEDKIDWIEGKSCNKIDGIFIRAPRIKKMGKNIEVLAEYKGDPVLVKEKNIIAGVFHPELTNDLTVYNYFLKI